ncbi:retrovirus-related pol polyprotein from transposon TNT 1-94 [Tanacetum coccineum]
MDRVHPLEQSSLVIQPWPSSNKTTDLPQILKCVVRTHESFSLQFTQLEAVRNSLLPTLHKSFHYQMDGENGILNGPLKEEVYVALRKGSLIQIIQKSLPSCGKRFIWIKASSKSLIYVDDIIFGSTNPKYSKRFEKLMHSRFEMSLMGEMKFFLGLLIHQSPKGIFISQAKYALEILKKHNMDNCHSIGTPLATKPNLDVDLSGEPVDQSNYRSKIGSLMYLTSSRPDLVQAVCYCARYQARPTQKHLKEVKRIFKYLKGTINMGLWYPKDSGFELTAFSDADHAGCLDTRKSTSGGIQFLGDKLVSWRSKKQNCTAMSSAETEYVTLSASCAQEHLKMEMEIPCSNKIKFITACSFSNDTFEDIMKAQVSVIKASATLNIQAFKIKKSVSISFRMTQVHKMAKDHMMMIRDYDWMMISKKLKDHIQVKLKPKSLKFTASDSQDTDQ